MLDSLHSAEALSRESRTRPDLTTYRLTALGGITTSKVGVFANMLIIVFHCGVQAYYEVLITSEGPISIGWIEAGAVVPSEKFVRNLCWILINVADVKLRALGTTSIAMPTKLTATCDCIVAEQSIMGEPSLRARLLARYLTWKREQCSFMWMVNYLLMVVAVFWRLRISMKGAGCRL
jgi:hypothetical protein